MLQRRQGPKYQQPNDPSRVSGEMEAAMALAVRNLQLLRHQHQQVLDGLHQYMNCGSGSGGRSAQPQPPPSFNPGCELPNPQKGFYAGGGAIVGKDEFEAMTLEGAARIHRNGTGTRSSSPPLPP